MNFYKNELENLSKNSSLREVKPLIQDGRYVILNGKKLLNLCSNDYLGISTDTALKEDFLNYYTKNKDSISIPAARLLSGTSPVYDDLEKFLAKKLNCEKTLLFNSGYHANLGIFSTLAGSDDIVFCDKLNHASIIDGIRLGGAKLVPFKHLDYEDLRGKLEKYRKNYKKAIIATESLFSMDGDFFDLEKLIDLKKEFDCLLIVDEAHSFGVFGGGRGLVSQLNLTNEVDLIMATFGKAIASYGAFCAGKEYLIDYLINFSRPFIFSTVFPQISAAFTKYVFENGELEVRAKKLHDLTKGLKIKSYILPVILGENHQAVVASRLLSENGFYALPIRYPTVPKNSARIRISMNSLNEKKEIEEAVKIIMSVRNEKQSFSISG